MNFVHDVIKILYTREGYLPDYPYHLISDEEMCDAFLRLPESISSRISSTFFKPLLNDTPTTVDWFNAYLNDTEDIMWFKTHYPLVDDVIKPFYKDLLNRIFYEIQEFKNNVNDDRVLPDWIYSYMLGIAIGPESDKLDIHDFISSMGVDNIEDEYTLDACIECLRISKNWLKKLIVEEGDTLRPPTMFGEPHVLKSIRLDQESLTSEDLSTS